MFEYFANSVANRWQDVEGLSDEGRLIVARIKEFVPTGNIPSVGCPKWRLGLLFNLMRRYMNTQKFWDVTQELCEKGLFVCALTYPGSHYGYHKNVETLAAQVIAEEKEFDAAKASFVLLLPEDASLIV